jgi:hypothetical protein
VARVLQVHRGRGGGRGQGAAGGRGRRGSCPGKKRKRPAGALADPEARAAAKEELAALLQAQAADRAAVAAAAAKADLRRGEREAVAAGKAPHSRKARALKDLALAHKFRELEGKGAAAVDKVLAKRRAKLSKKDRSWLPPAPAK